MMSYDDLDQGTPSLVLENVSGSSWMMYHPSDKCTLLLSDLQFPSN